MLFKHAISITMNAGVVFLQLLSKRVQDLCISAADILYVRKRMEADNERAQTTTLLSPAFTPVG